MTDRPVLGRWRRVGLHLLAAYVPTPGASKSAFLSDMAFATRQREDAAAIVQQDVIVEVLRCLGLPTEPPVPAKARPPPQAELDFPAPTWDA